jgi:hypothetical protein
MHTNLKSVGVPWGGVGELQTTNREETRWPTYEVYRILKHFYWEESAEEDIWTEERWNTKGLEEIT